MINQYIHHSTPTIYQDDINAVTSLLQNGMIASGGLKRDLEMEFSEYFDQKPVQLTSSGRSALYLILKSLQLSPSDDVIIPTYVCDSLYQMVELAELNPIVVDVNDTYCLSLETIQKSITESTKVIVYVHQFGYISEEIESIVNFCKDNSILLIEDIAHAIGATLHGRTIGTFTDAAFCSFQATKMLTSGEGGLAVMNNSAFENSFNDACITYSKLLSFNDLQASLLQKQFHQLDHFLKRRTEIASIYDQILNRSTRIQIPFDRQNTHVQFRYIVQLDASLVFENIQEKMHERQIAIRKGVDQLIHQKKHSGSCPNADRLITMTCSLPIYPKLTNEEAEHIARNFIEVIDECV